MPEEILNNSPLGELGLIVLRSITDLGKKVDNDLKRISNIDDPDFSFIIDISETRFSNGEGKVQIDQSVRGKDIFILCDIGNYGVTYKMFGAENRMTPDEHFADIKRVISAINGKANSSVKFPPSSKFGSDIENNTIGIKEMTRLFQNLDIL